MAECVFCKIAAGKIPTNFEYQDKDLLVFADIKPQAPIHLLIVPRGHIKDLTDASDEIFTKMLAVAKKLIKKHNLDKRGYRLAINGGRAALVGHLHLHLLGEVTLERTV